MTLFCKKNFNGSIFTNFNLNELQNTKKAIIECYSRITQCNVEENKCESWSWSWKSKKLRTSLVKRMLEIGVALHQKLVLTWWVFYSCHWDDCCMCSNILISVNGVFNLFKLFWENAARVVGHLKSKCISTHMIVTSSHDHYVFPVLNVFLYF